MNTLLLFVMGNYHVDHRPAENFESYLPYTKNPYRYSVDSQISMKLEYQYRHGTQSTQTTAHTEVK